MSNAVSLRPPKYRRHKAKGLALVTINGRDVYLGRYGSAASKEEYRRVVAEHLQGSSADASSKSDITVAEVMAAYLKFASRYCIYLDGMSGALHGDPVTAARDQEIRSWLRNNGYQVIEITYVELDDRSAMIRHFKKLARFLEGKDMARKVEEDSTWFERRS